MLINYLGTTVVDTITQQNVGERDPNTGLITSQNPTLEHPTLIKVSGRGRQWKHLHLAISHIPALTHVFCFQTLFCFLSLLSGSM